MNTIPSTYVDCAHPDIRDHAQTIVNELGSLASESSGSHELRDTLLKAARQTASLDQHIRETQQSLTQSQKGACQLALRVDQLNERYKSLEKTTDILKLSVKAEL